jgi:hypothetical protein
MTAKNEKNICSWDDIFIYRIEARNPYEGIDIIPAAKNLLFAESRVIPEPSRRCVKCFEIDVFTRIGVIMLKDAISIAKSLPHNYKSGEYSILTITKDGKYPEIYKELNRYFKNYAALIECFNFPLFSNIEFKISKKNELSFKILKE